MAVITDEKSEFLAQLISLVQQNKILYEKKNPHYYNRRKKEKVWNDIATQTNKTFSECRNKCTALREKFVRELKKREKLEETGGVPEHDWDLFNEMLFLKDVHKRRNVEKVEAMKCETSSVDENPFSFEEECITSPPLKTKSFDGFCEQFGTLISKLEERLDVEPQTNNDNDADELFVRTVVSMIQDLPSSVKDELKSDIFNKILEAIKRFRTVA